MLPYLLPHPTPLDPLPFTSDGLRTHRFVPTTVLCMPMYYKVESRRTQFERSAVRGREVGTAISRFTAARKH
jgi:hypothetical protein